MRKEYGAAEAVSTAEEDSFEAFFIENYPRVYALLYRLTGQKAEAEDLAVETFVRLWQRSPKFSDQMTGWLYRVATRLGYNALRDAKRRTRYEQRAILYEVGRNASSNPADEVAQLREKDKVRRVLQQMSHRSAEIVVLFHSGFTYKEIASVVDVSPNSVGTLLARAEREFERIYREGG